MLSTAAYQAIKMKISLPIWPDLTFLTSQDDDDHRSDTTSACGPVWKVLGPTMAFTVCSVSITALNKMGVSVSDAPLALAVLQMLAAAGATGLASGRKLFSQFGKGSTEWALSTPLLFIISLGTSMTAFKYVSVSAFVVVRNLGPLVSLWVELLFHKCNHPTLKCNAKTTASLFAIAFGVALYEMNDVSFSFLGSLLLVLNLVFNVLSHNVERHYLAVKKVDAPRNGLVFLKNGVGSVELLILLLVYQPAQLGRLLDTCAGKEGLWAVVIIVSSCVAGTAMSHAGLWLQSVVTATSFMVIGCTTRIILILWGIVFQGDTCEPVTVLGAFISILGAAVYSLPTSSLPAFCAYIQCMSPKEGHRTIPSTNTKELQHVQMVEAKQSTGGKEPGTRPMPENPRGVGTLRL